MLVIRKEQTEAMSAHMRSNFEDRMVRHLARTLPGEYRALSRMGADPVRELIKQGIHRAASYRIETERAVARYIELMLRVAPDFEERPEMAWCQPIMKDTKLPGHVRLELIHQQLASRPVEESKTWID